MAKFPRPIPASRSQLAPCEAHFFLHWGDHGLVTEIEGEAESTSRGTVPCARADNLILRRIRDGQGLDSRVAPLKRPGPLRPPARPASTCLAHSTASRGCR